MKEQRLIYVGPSLKGARLQKYQVFIGGYPEVAMEIAEAKPWFKRLFVPVAKLAEAEKEIETCGKPLNKYYRNAMEV